MKKNILIALIFFDNSLFLYGMEKINSNPISNSPVGSFLRSTAISEDSTQVTSYQPRTSTSQTSSNSNISTKPRAGTVGHNWPRKPAVDVAPSLNPAEERRNSITVRERADSDLKLRRGTASRNLLGKTNKAEGISLNLHNRSISLSEVPVLDDEPVVSEKKMVHSRSQPKIEDDSDKINILQCLRNDNSTTIVNMVAKNPALLKETFGEGNTLLHCIAKYGANKTAHLVIPRFGINLNPFNEKGNTPLMEAILNGHETIVTELIERDGFDPMVRNTLSNQSALYFAAMQDRINIVRELATRALKKLKYYKVNEPMFGELSDFIADAILAAAEYGRIHIIKYFLDKGIILNVKNRQGFTPIMLAAQSGHLDLLTHLLDEKEPAVNSQSFENKTTALMVATMAGHLPIVKLLARKKNITINLRNSDGDTALILALKFGKDDIFKFLATRDHEKDTAHFAKTELQEALFLAILHEKKQLLEYLLTTEVFKLSVNERDEQGNTPLLYAAQRGKEEICNFLLSLPETDINAKNKKGHNTLGCAVEGDQREVILALLDNPSLDIRIVIGESEDTLLMWAIRKNYADVTKKLIPRLGLRINDTNKQTDTALLLACVEGNKTIVEQLLVSTDIDLEIANKNTGNTPLIVSILKYRENITLLLLEQPKININTQNLNQDSALMLAIMLQQKQIALALLRNPKIIVTFENRQEQSAHTFAMQWSDPEIISELKRKYRESQLPQDLKDKDDGCCIS